MGVRCITRIPLWVWAAGITIGLAAALLFEGRKPSLQPRALQPTTPVLMATYTPTAVHGSPIPVSAEHAWHALLLAVWEDPDQALPQVEALSAQEGPYRDAARTLLAALYRARESPHPGYRWTEIGRGLARAGEWSWAEAAWMRAVRAAPDYGPAWTYLGLGEAHKGRFDRAREAWLRAARLATHDPLSRYLLGLLALHQDHSATATAWLWRAVALQPDEPLYRYALAHALARQRGFFPQAWAVMAQSVARAPQNPLAYTLAATFALEHQVYLESHALPWLRRVLQQNPDDVPALVLMARVYLELGQPDLAWRFLARAAVLAPNNPDLNRALALYYRMTGDVVRAAEYERRVQEMAPHGLWPEAVP